MYSNPPSIAYHSELSDAEAPSGKRLKTMLTKGHFFSFSLILELPCLKLVLQERALSMSGFFSMLFTIFFVRFRLFQTPSVPLSFQKFGFVVHHTDAFKAAPTRPATLPTIPSFPAVPDRTERPVCTIVPGVCLLYHHHYHHDHHPKLFCRTLMLQKEDFFFLS